MTFSASSDFLSSVAPVIIPSVLFKLEIPTAGFKSLEKIEKAIIEHNPDIVLSIGQATGRYDITVEKVGINLDDYRIPDNLGQQFI
ncbi:pyroglutamyl-peptidase I family protein, partial [Oceanivirga salmonicida]|uniref:pyroglutamyl-peptidase I family protein n=1 Tax=Oceanivirga salmonicida TaxID=1769291 RepID=UPI003FA3BFAE